MVGIVIVSHSAKLAAGVEELARQVTQTPVSISLAAGIDDPENPFGTDALQIQAAIESVYRDAGVMVLMDLGSAVLNAEMALELLPEAQRENVRLCAAPLVEGAIAAVIAASFGASLDEVIASAQNALTPKLAQIGEEGHEVKKEEEIEPDLQPSQEIQLTVANPQGLHLRPAAQFVSTAAKFRANITVENLTKQSKRVDAKSVNQVMLLGVRQGDKIGVTVTGEDGALALSALQKLVENQLNEFPVAPPVPPSPSGSPSSLTGIPTSPGIAIAPLIFYQPTIPKVSDQTTEHPQTEWQTFQQAITTAKKRLEYLVNQESSDLASLFQAHLLYLNDPDLIEQTQHLIFKQGLTAATAWKTVIDQLIASYQALSDPYLQARTSDVKDIGIRVLRLLLGDDMPTIELPHSGILVTPELTVSQISALPPGQVQGICTTEGTPTSHSALIANQLGIPMVVGVDSAILSLPPHTQLALNGATGQVWVNPSEPECQTLRAQSQVSAQSKSLTEAVTLEGRKVPVLANILNLTNARSAVEYGADGIGLLRTEFLYLDRPTPPTEAEQWDTIEAIATVLGERPLTIRTLDIGGDKSVAYLNLPTETNPFLGQRGIRQSLAHPEPFKTQLRAILRASAQHPLKLMFPMITSIQEVRAAKQLLQEVQAELQQKEIPFDPSLTIGIMIEVPSVVIMADQLAKEVDFFSIGTNDLSQYLMAAERTNANVAKLADAFEPAVLRMIRRTVDAAHKAGITVSVCGQLASEPTAVPILLGLGVDELSVNPPAIPEIKAKIASLMRSEVNAIASAVLQLDSAAAVRDYVSSIAVQK